MNKQTLRDAIIVQKIRYDRGQGWLSWMRQIIYVTAGIGAIAYFFTIQMGLLMSLLLAILYVFVCWIIGAADHIRGIFLRENEVSTKEFNPYFRKLEQKIKGLEDKLESRDAYVLHKRNNNIGKYVASQRHKFNN